MNRRKQFDLIRVAFITVTYSAVCQQFKEQNGAYSFSSLLFKYYQANKEYFPYISFELF